MSTPRSAGPVACFLDQLHPLPKLIVCLIWLVAAIMVFDARFQAITIILAAVALMLFSRFSVWLVLGLMVPFALFGAGFLTTSILFRDGSDFADKMAAEAPFVSEGVSAGIVLFLRAIACGMVSALFTLTTDPGDLVKALMKNWRLSPRIGYALFSALNLVPDLASEAQQIRLARAMKRGRLPRRIPGLAEGFSLMLPLLAFAIRRASRAAIAMEARGLSRDGPRTILGAPVLARRDGVFAALALALLAVALVQVWLFR
ncbi:MAG: energy-coupling factor transporter transmembrane protein EcfT [Beijerinckiaceae bacterium]|jgi:energy-coupling factor transport system permease protein|nr:energy-coupling factor transporter transmembrane protein EcfT [Beijerinckiaceae bacterium]